MARTKSAGSATILLPCCIGLAVLALCALMWVGCRKPVDRYVASTVGPLDPGVRVRDMGSGRSKCYSCEDQSGLDGSKPKCLTCTQPSFKYLTETIIAEQGAAANGACHACRGAP
jgi:hypothetical protein